MTSKNKAYLQTGCGIGLIHKPPEIDISRHITTKLLPETYAGVRIYCLKRGISMQELLETLLQHVLMGDARVEAILDAFVDDKRERHYRKLSPTDAESLFDTIERESPFEKK